MEIKQVMVNDLNDVLNNVKSVLVDAEKMDVLSQIDFYENRLRFLESEANKLQTREQESQNEINEIIAEFKRKLIEKGSEVISLKQMSTLTYKEMGACEYKLKELQEQCSSNREEDVI